MMTSTTRAQQQRRRGHPRGEEGSPPRRRRGGEGLQWGSTSTRSSTCGDEDEEDDGGGLFPFEGTTIVSAQPQSLWSLSVDPPDHRGRGPRPPPPHSLPSSAQRVDLVRGARGRRPSVVANLLLDGERGGTEIDAHAFHRYYEGGSTLGGEAYPPAAAAAAPPLSPRGGGRERSICGGALGGTLASLGVVLPTKLEALLKLLAQSLHQVLQALCSRKARRKDRECSSSTHEHKLYLEEAVLERNIPETDLRQLVDLPPGLGYEEWLASHTIDFFHHINLLYGTVCEFCTLTGCPDMTGPGLRQYLWFDEKGKKTRVAAPQYVDYVMTFTQNTVNDESIFPTKFESEFPSSFESIVKKIHRLLFHVVAHLYHAHFREVVLLSLHAHLNCVFAHFVLFNEKFKLVDDKETEILRDLVLALKIHPEGGGGEEEGGGGGGEGGGGEGSFTPNEDRGGEDSNEGGASPLAVPHSSAPGSVSGSPCSSSASMMTMTTTTTRQQQQQQQATTTTTFTASATSSSSSCGYLSHYVAGDEAPLCPFNVDDDDDDGRRGELGSSALQQPHIISSPAPVGGSFVNGVSLADALP